MEDNKNPIRNEIADELNKPSFRDKVFNLITGNKEVNFDEIINKFKSMLENSSLIEKIINDDELRKRVCEIHDMIEYKHINEK